MYTGVATWKSAQSKQFETIYRATDRSWEQQLQTWPGDTNEVIFEVGNDTSCFNKPGNVYCNGPLPAGKSFRVRLFSCTAAGCSVSEPSGLFMTAGKSLSLLNKSYLLILQNNK
ncbi:unnamed protein product [Candidula unifasciata]|uniref:Uncharacterized protein n=1 Tax=Candidula unifasciata TaxID=100452 RepID=A0A8S3Z221_9EUPU|nr:unnamed protein product [Candidula unifasciata]